MHKVMLQTAVAVKTQIGLLLFCETSTALACCSEVGDMT